MGSVSQHEDVGRFDPSIVAHMPCNMIIDGTLLLTALWCTMGQIVLKPAAPFEGLIELQKLWKVA